MKTSSQARSLICLIPDNDSELCDTRASFAASEAILFGKRFTGMRITAKITSPTKAIPICVYNKYSVANSW